MEIRTESVAHKPEVTLVRLSGDIDSLSVSQLNRGASDLLAQYQYKLILDFADVPYINSSGLGVIASVLKTVREKGGDVKFLHVPPSLLELFDIVRLTKIVQIYESEEEAVESFAS